MRLAEYLRLTLSGTTSVSARWNALLEMRHPEISVFFTVASCLCCSFTFFSFFYLIKWFLWILMPQGRRLGCVCHPMTAFVFEKNPIYTFFLVFLSSGFKSLLGHVFRPHLRTMRSTISSWGAGNCNSHHQGASFFSFLLFICTTFL